MFNLDKTQLRKKVFKVRNTFSDEEIKRRSAILMDRIKEMDVFKNSNTIMIYVSFDKEVFTHDFIKYCLDIGKKVITPICRNEDRTLILGETDSFPRGFEETKYGILELNPNTCNQGRVEDIDLIIMPGVAFTKKGDRLGYGAGYYDKLLSQKSNKALTVAPVYKEFIFDEIPTEEHDIPIDYIVTEEEIYGLVK